METLQQKLERVLAEEVALVPYDPSWPAAFAAEKASLLALFPAPLIRRIEHFGSTAVPGLCAKPIVDMLIEVSSLDEARSVIAPRLERRGYDYFWRPTSGDSTPPFYAWFIKRDAAGRRSHHLHMVEADFEHWERLLFRDYLIEQPQVAAEYARLKQQLAGAFAADRVAYTRAKTEFIVRITELAKRHYRGREP